MISEELRFELENKVLEFISQNKGFDKPLEDAKQSFFGIEEEADPRSLNMDFNEWLIYDYKFNNKTFLQYFLETNISILSEDEKVLANLVADKYISIYELKEIIKGICTFKDIFSNKELFIKNIRINSLNLGDLVFSKVVNNRNENHFYGSKIVIPGIFKSSIQRNIISHYESYKAQNQFGSWEDFLRKNNLLLYKYVDAATEVLTKESQEDETNYEVWQSIYLIKDTINIKNKLLENRLIKLDSEENGILNFKIFDKGQLLAEFIVTNNRGELECSSKEDREKAKAILEKDNKDFLSHYKDEVVGIDDII